MQRPAWFGPSNAAWLARRLRRWCLLLACSASLPLAGCAGSDSSAPPPGQGLALQLVTAGLTAPVFMSAAPGDISRLFIVEQGGRIRIFDRQAGLLRTTPFLDVSALVSSGGERGLLGLAFDPAYPVNLNFYVFYTNTGGDLVVARYQRTFANPDLADPLGTILLTVPHPGFSNHNGGMLAFGPEGCLYVATGDGGGSGDPSNNAQNTLSRLGKILRIDPSSGGACTLGGLNPFALGGGAPEVWSFGLRNPWRFSFDRQTGDLYIGDVGQDLREEIDAVVGAQPGRSVNFGWRLMEGTLCFNPPSGCNPGGLTLPVLEYEHADGACSVVGGYVYRGQALSALNGTYFYADFCAGFVRSFRLSGGQALEATQWPALSPGPQITSFGEDEAGELYLMSLAGSLWKIVAD
jgi:hypothetical protein